MEHTKGIAEITRKVDFDFPYYREIRIDSVLIAKVEGDTIAEAQTNAERIVECWNGYASLTEQVRELKEALQLTKEYLETGKYQGYTSQQATDYLKRKIEVVLFEI